MGLGILRPRTSDNAAGHVGRDRMVLRADLPAIGRGCSICGASGDGSGGRGDGTRLAGRPWRQGGD